MNTDPISDLFTRIRNAQGRGKETVVVPYSGTKLRILQVLLEEGYIKGYEVDQSEASKSQLVISLSYQTDGRPVIREIKRLSTPGRRWYVEAKAVPEYKSGLGTVIVSTSKGMLTGVAAKRENVGGELICSVF